VGSPATGCDRPVQIPGSTGRVTFRKANQVFSIVKDRGFWYLHDEEGELKEFPSRKSRGLVEKDVIAWLETKNA
jgi:hypothetical protein